jgi:hypothetical protein
MTDYCNTCAEALDDGDTVVCDHDGAYHHYDCWRDGGCEPPGLKPHDYQGEQMKHGTRIRNGITEATVDGEHWFQVMGQDKPISEHHNPDHYRAKSVEPIDAIRSWLGDVAFVQYCRGQVIRYASRLGDKDESVKEARKLEVYARWMRETLEGKELSK